MSVKEILKEDKKKSQKRLQLSTGKQTGSLFYLGDAIATATCMLEKKVQEMRMGGGGRRRGWEVSQRFTHFPLSIQAETCLLTAFKSCLKFKCQIMRQNIE